MERMTRAGAVLVAVSLVLAGSTALRAQGQPTIGAAGGVTTLKSGQTLVVGARATALRPEARLRSPAALQFRRLPMQVITEVQAIATAIPGNTLTAVMPSTPFTLTPRAPVVDGRGFLNGAGLGLNGSSNDLQFGADGWIGVWSNGSSTDKRYTLHFQLREIRNTAGTFIITLADGSTYNVPAKPNQVQDILVLVPLPNDQPITGPHLLASIKLSGAAVANLTGVEITPM